MVKKYKPVIGLEVHVELKTQSKMFCDCVADYFGEKPNVHVCSVCLGLPGALPVPNQKAIDWTVLIGKALNCTINPVSKFDRKHYFYPDLPKGYQISQYDEPIASNGRIKIPNPKSSFDKLRIPSAVEGQIPNKSQIQNSKSKTNNNGAMNQWNNDNKEFRIRRVHLEEDTAKLLHMGDETLIDFNRSGVPLVEIVTEPDFDNSEDVKRFLEELQVIIRYLGVSDADMEKGSMRLEPNISVISFQSSAISNRSSVVSSRQSVISNQQSVVSDRYSVISKIQKTDKLTTDNRLPSYKVEVKNINSFRFVKQAIEHEVERQIRILEEGETPKQETRGFDEKTQKTYSQRTKEEAHDYRYFPEPDIPPLTFAKKYIDSMNVPELPQEKVNRYVLDFGIRYQDAYILTRETKTASVFESVNSKLKAQSSIHSTSSGLIQSNVEVSKLQLKTQNLSQTLANVIINKKDIANLSVEELYRKIKESKSPKQTDEKTLDASIKHLIEVNKKAVEDYKKGKENAIMFLVGQVMREMKGKADAKVIISKIKDQIAKIQIK